MEIFGKEFRLPFAPRGGGWTKAVYLDAESRLMRNSLGDTLFFERGGEDSCGDTLLSQKGSKGSSSRGTLFVKNDSENSSWDT